MIVTIRNQVEAFLYTVRVECEQGWCEARNLPYAVALAYTQSTDTTPASSAGDTPAADAKVSG
jgi:hypothetical protein